MLNGHPLYPQVVTRMKDRENFLDLGCCFGQDLRQLVADGAPSENIYGLDIEGPLIDVGYDLFMDRGKIKSTFIVGDVYNPHTNWDQLVGKMDIINASAFFHLFPWPKQVEASCLLVRFGRPRAGTVIIGRQSTYFKSFFHFFPLVQDRLQRQVSRASSTQTYFYDANAKLKYKGVY